MSVTERRPICPSCHQPLCGELVASSCNHVFHRGCLTAALGAKKPCAKCGEDLQPKLQPGLTVAISGLQFAGSLNGHTAQCQSFDEAKQRWLVRLTGGDGETKLHSLNPKNLTPADPQQACLSLYGVNFGEGLEGGIAALTAKMAEEDSAEAVRRGERLRQVAALLSKKNQVRKMKESLAKTRELVQESKEAFAKQKEKHGSVAKSLEKKKEERRRLERDAKRELDVHASLSSQMDLARQRDTAHEYWEKIKAGQDEQALRYLNTMVTLAASPARIVVEVARLRNHVNETLALQRKEASSAARRLQEAERRLLDLDREERRAAQKDRPRAALESAAKRARI